MTKTKAVFGNLTAPLSGLVGIVVVFFAGLSLPLVGPDEPRYSQVAREMFERGDWITPTLGGFHWFEKPALLYWLQIASYHLFGVSEFAARFGSALFGIGTVASLGLLGYHLQKKGDAGDGFTLWITVIAATTVGIIAFAHGASFDIILTFPMTGAMVSFYIYESGRRRLPLVLFYVFVGLAILAKGLVGIVFPFAIVAFYYLLIRRRPPIELLISSIWGTAIAALIAATWYLPMYMRHGYEFIDQFFIQHHFQRYTSNKYLHPQPFHFFFWVLPLMMIPWTPFFLVALWKFGRGVFDRFKGQSKYGAKDSVSYFAFAWMAVPVVFFSFSGSKLPGYILPAVPAAIILTALVVRDLAETSRRWSFVGRALAIATYMIVLLGTVFFARPFAEADSVKAHFEEAERRGLADVPVLMLHGVSHNAEFYAPGRILRDAEGKQKRLFGPPEVIREARAMHRKSVLVLTPTEWSHQLTQSPHLNSEILKDNGEWTLVWVELSEP